MLQQTKKWEDDNKALPDIRQKSTAKRICPDPFRVFTCISFSYIFNTIFGPFMILGAKGKANHHM